MSEFEKRPLLKWTPPLVWKPLGDEPCQEIDQHIQTWLDKRKELLTLMAELLHLEPFNDECIKFEEALQRFCQVLVDYTAAGHFELYSEIFEVIESNEETKAQVSEVPMEHLEAIALVSAEFSDKYANGAKETKAIRGELNALLQAVEDRFELEEILIKLYCTARGDFSNAPGKMGP